MIFDALLAILRHASTSWWKANKDLLKFRCYLLLLFKYLLFF